MHECGAQALTQAAYHPTMRAMAYRLKRYSRLRDDLGTVFHYDPAKIREALSPTSPVEQALHNHVIMDNVLANLPLQDLMRQADRPYLLGLEQEWKR